MKFTSLHPDSHKQFQNLLQSAKVKPTDVEDEANECDEIRNMLKNKILSKFREEDEFCEIQRRSHKLMNKKISWSQNLIQVQILIDWQNSYKAIEEQNWKVVAHVIALALKCLFLYIYIV